MGLIRKAKSFLNNLKGHKTLRKTESRPNPNVDKAVCEKCGIDTSGMSPQQMKDAETRMLMVYPSYMELKLTERELESYDGQLTTRGEVGLSRAHTVCEYHHVYDADDLQSVKIALQVRWQDGGAYVIPGENLEDQINLEMARNICLAHNVGIYGMPPQEIIRKGKRIYHRMYDEKVTQDTTNHMIDDFNRHERNRQPAYDVSNMDLDEATNICRQHGVLVGNQTDAQVFNEAKDLSGASGSYLHNSTIPVWRAKDMCEDAYGFDATNMMSERDMLKKARHLFR